MKKEYIIEAMNALGQEDKFNIWAKSEVEANKIARDSGWFVTSLKRNKPIKEKQSNVRIFRILFLISVSVLIFALGFICGIVQ